MYKGRLRVLGTITLKRHQFDKGDVLYIDPVSDAPMVDSYYFHKVRGEEFGHNVPRKILQQYFREGRIKPIESV